MMTGPSKSVTYSYPKLRLIPHSAFAPGQFAVVAEVKAVCSLAGEAASLAIS